MEITVHVEKVEGGYIVKRADSEVNAIFAVASTVKQAAKRAGDLIESALKGE